MSLISGSDWSFVILLLIVILSALTLMVISCMVRRETTTMAKTTEISNKILQVSIVFIAPPPRPSPFCYLHENFLLYVSTP